MKKIKKQTTSEQIKQEWSKIITRFGSGYRM